MSRCNLKFVMVLILAGIILPVAGFANTVVLKSGEKLEGKIASQTDTEIQLELEG